MNWQQVTDPFQNSGLSALLATVPVLFIFWALIIRKMKGYQASLLATVLSILIAVTAYGMPIKLALLSTANGALYGLFPICWIIITAVFLFNLTVKSGQFEIIKHYMASITSDRRLQALLIAFAFGSFLEGMAGFGAPVAITAAMLVGLGFHPLYAAGLCLIANTAPVAFGSVGIPITVASQVTSIPELAISQMVGRTLPLLSVFLPFYLVVIMAGIRKTREVMPAIVVAGVSFAFLQWLSSNMLGPALPDVIAGIGAIVSLIVLLRFWKPRTTWHFPHEPAPARPTDIHYTAGQILRAWSPFIMLTLVIIAWGTQPIKEVLNAYGQVQFAFPGLHQVILDAQGNALPHLFKFNYLSATGTAVLLAALLSIPLVGISYREAADVGGQTLRQLLFPIITIAAVMGFAYIVNDSGISLTMAEALASTGVMFPFFAPMLGWLGVFITGSDTSANALFGKLQASAATSLGLDPVVTVSANVSGGVIGKMISPQSIAVAAAAGNLVGKESDLFRFTVKHSFYLLLFVCLLVLAQAYVVSWIIPDYQLLVAGAAQAAPDLTKGYVYLMVLATGLLAFVVGIKAMNKKKAMPGNSEEVAIR